MLGDKLDEIYWAAATEQLHSVSHNDGSGHFAGLRAVADAAREEAGQLAVDDVARVLCHLELRASPYTSIEDLVAPNIELWTRYRWEAERLIEGLQPLFTRAASISTDKAGAADA